MSQTMDSKRQRGWWYPRIFIGMFAVVVGVNGALAYFATSTFSGLSTDQAYDKGLKYNQNLELARAQEKLGWHVDIAGSATDPSVREVSLSVSYHDRDGRPLDGLAVRAQLRRPLIKDGDTEIALAPLGGGVYGAKTRLPSLGVWDVNAVAIGPDTSFQSHKRLVLP